MGLTSFYWRNEGCELLYLSPLFLRLSKHCTLTLYSFCASSYPPVLDFSTISCCEFNHDRLMPDLLWRSLMRCYSIFWNNQGRKVLHVSAVVRWVAKTVLNAMAPFVSKHDRPTWDIYRECLILWWKLLKRAREALVYTQLVHWVAKSLQNHRTISVCKRDRWDWG